MVYRTTYVQQTLLATAPGNSLVTGSGCAFVGYYIALSHTARLLLLHKFHGLSPAVTQEDHICYLEIRKHDFQGVLQVSNELYVSSQLDPFHIKKVETELCSLVDDYLVDFLSLPHI